MALVSPGVEVTITDESQYLPAPTNSVPLVLLATAQNKANASGTGIAAATTAANANKLYQVTSQRDLVNLYGKPFFYETTNGTPINGYELNEYGLLAAYSLLGGAGNRCFVLRADIDLASLVGRTSRPTGAPANGTYWLDTATSTWGIYEFNAVTGNFELQTPIVISDSAELSGGVPLNSIGSIGDYAINTFQPTGSPTDPAEKTFFYKTSSNQWVSLGGGSWRSDTPVVQGTISNGTISSPTSNFTLDASGLWSRVISVSGTSVNDIASAINALNTPVVTARVVSGKLEILSNQLVSSTTVPPYITLTDGTNTPLADVGISNGTYYQPTVAYGTSAQMPLWASSQTYPRPTGSVWIKIGQTGNGLYPALSVWRTSTQSWSAKNISQYTTDWNAIEDLDSTGGAAIPAGTVYGQYSFNGTLPNAPYYLWERIATGPTVITGDNTSPAFNSTNCVGVGPYTLFVNVSVPASTSLSSVYTVTVPNNATATDFVTAWYAAGIPNTTAAVDATGALTLTHTKGGVILLSDIVNNQSNGVVAEAGFNIGTVTGVKYGPVHSYGWNNIACTGGSGSGATFNVIGRYGAYILNGTGIFTGGTGYTVGDLITISGANLSGATPTNNLQLRVTTVGAGNAITGVVYAAGSAIPGFAVLLSNWVEFPYTNNQGAPVVNPANNTNWFYSVVDQVDIMVQKQGQWIGYRNTTYDSNGFPSVTGTPATDPNGPIVSTTAPTTQSDGTALVYGDLWIDTSDLELYPVIRRWQEVSGTDQWVLIDNTDQTSSKGVLFQDARWSSSGAIDPTNDPIPTIVSLLTSDYIDLDAPTPSTYPSGMLLFNTRRSGYNVKQFRTNYFTGANYPNAGAYNPAAPTNTSNLPLFSYTWVSVSGNQANGAAYMGRKAQRAMVVQALRASIDTNTSIRDEDNQFNLIATPNYPELQPNMIVLNADRGETGFIIGDTPLGLPDSATAIQAWATNAADAASTGEDGLVTRNTYMGLFYPSGLANDLDGNQVVVPPSHMMLRTILTSDTKSFPWLAPAGTRRGNIDNALNIGYLNRQTGEFITTKTRIGIRDVLYTNQINPLVFFTGVGLLNYGNKTSFASQSALDRINVARLVNYVRRQLTIAARPFVFEPNDALTRQQIAGVVQTLMVDLVAKRGIYDYFVQCDEQNNPPAVIDRNELYVNVAIEPVKAVEFIYIPVRILNTGELSAGG
jgi:hypothetical protein